jgi:hypothetical protein
MEDTRAQPQKFRTDAKDCALISKLATDKAKRELFGRLAEHLNSWSIKHSESRSRCGHSRGAEPGASGGIGACFPYSCSNCTLADHERLLQMVVARRPRVLIGAALRRTSKAIKIQLAMLRHELAEQSMGAFGSST